MLVLDPNIQQNLEDIFVIICFYKQLSHIPWTYLINAEIWSNGALDPWSGMGVYPKNSKGPEGPMVQEINEDERPRV